ncbi:IS200/IS605 family transposase [Lederbergia ruris]|nr:IS200/IS605 family transposase [Lederbergia ruris]
MVHTGEVKRGRGYVYSIQYHVVWCVKYRHKVLTGDIDVRLRELLHQIATDNGFTISEMETDCDHIHLLIDCTPQHSIPTMIKALKGVSARLLFKEYPVLKKKLWGGHLWNPSYFVATVSENTGEQIRQYIQNQKGGEK